MSERPPDFDDLVGPEVESPERERLRRVHELLVAAGPPPELEGSGPPATAPIRLEPRRRRVALLAFAAALAASSFAVGVYAGSGGGPEPERVIAMSGSGATASIDVFEADAAGNWPLELEIEGLPSGDGRTYELWLTRKGKLKALCGGFVVDDRGKTVVPLNVPWKLDDFDGWVVVAAGSDEPLLST